VALARRYDDPLYRAAFDRTLTTTILAVNERSDGALSTCGSDALAEFTGRSL
jgi:hypothetical protein